MTTVTIDREDLRRIVGAAESYVEDLASGLDDGTYEDDPGCAEIEDAIERANHLLED